MALGIGSATGQETESGASLAAIADEAMTSAISANRAAFAAQVVASWQDRAQARGVGAGWDIELRRALASLTPGELFVASKARTWEELIGRAKNYRNPVPNTVGGTFNDYVYVPITPCRIVDTRPAKGGSGPITAGTSKNFFSNNNPLGAIVGQGGSATGCPAIPLDPPAIVATVTAVTPAAAGNITAYPYLATLPTASTVNYALPGTGLNLANTTVIPTCVICGLDFSIFANAGTVDVVVDVVGYFEVPQCPVGSTGFNGHCYETTTRAAATVFNAGAACAIAGGRLASGSELRSLGHCGITPPLCTGLLTLDLTAEWTDSVFSADNINYFAMGIANGGGFSRIPTLTLTPYRCVYDN
jgi:hypothetical protein